MKQKKSNLEIVEKAWWWYDNENDCMGSYRDNCYCHGETLSKAKSALFRELKDIGYLDTFAQLFEGFIFRRAPDRDRVKMPTAPVLETLTEEQRHIIGHANGNDSSEPGYRDHYCTADGNPDCEHLVSLGLMKHGRTLESHTSSRYYLLTEDGAMAALSDTVIERRQAEQVIPWVPHLANEKGMLCLESIKANPELLTLIPECSPCRIYSSQWGYYWRPNGRGYGPKEDAGIYTFKDAYSRTSHCGSEKGIWYDFLIEPPQEHAA